VPITSPLHLMIFRDGRRIAPSRTGLYCELIISVSRIAASKKISLLDGEMGVDGCENAGGLKIGQLLIFPLMQ
jgi:hypothetical protein